MEIIKYLERVTTIFNPDGTVRGSEAHEHTGYLEERDVPDAPGAKQLVFVVVKPEVRAIAPGDLDGALNGGCPAIEDAAMKAEQIKGLLRDAEERAAQLTASEKLCETHAATIEAQAAVIAERDAALIEGEKRERALQDAVQQAARESAAIAGELAAREAELAELRAAEAEAAAPAE